MGKKKSLGSSPIGYQSENGSMNFIPDLGVAETKKKTKTSKYYSRQNRKQTNGHNQSEETDGDDSSPEKKIVSYNLEKDLIQKVKDLANKKNMYYSTLVSKALKHWIAENG